MNDFPFHSLADLFPLIEGKEFDELVSSIRENGLREPIVLFEGAILDGRNRYRACKAAGIEAMTEDFSGGDPIRFVIDKNINRRHLTIGQRAMIAAQFATLKPGNVEAQVKSGVRNRTPPLTAEQVGERLQVGRTTVFAAKTILAHGTPEEIEAVKRGEAGVETVANDIRAKRSPAERKRRRDDSLSGKGKNPERIETMRINAQIWGDLRDSIEKLSRMPLASDVAAIVRGLGNGKLAIVNDRLPQALEWLKEFASAWSNSDQAIHAEKQDRNGSADAGDGDGASGPQPAQSAAA